MMTSPLRNDDLDIALLDYVQREWDRELERLLRGLSKRSRLVKALVRAQ